MEPSEQVRVTTGRAFAIFMTLGVSIIPFALPPSIDDGFYSRLPVAIPYLIVVCLLVTWALTRAFRVAMIADANGLQIRNMFTTHTLCWADVAELHDRQVFYIQGDLTGDGFWALEVRARDGRRFKVWATAKGRSSWPDAGVKSVGQLAASRNVVVNLTEQVEAGRKRSA
jgi:hypothetical protein